MWHLVELKSTINIPDGKTFGFVEDVFILGNVIEGNNITNENSIRVKAIMSFDKSKGKWGWKGYKILE